MRAIEQWLDCPRAVGSRGYSLYKEVSIFNIGYSHIEHLLAGYGERWFNQIYQFLLFVGCQAGKSRGLEILIGTVLNNRTSIRIAVCHSGRLLRYGCYCSEVLKRFGIRGGERPKAYFYNFKVVYIEIDIKINIQRGAHSLPCFWYAESVLNIAAFNQSYEKCVCLFIHNCHIRCGEENTLPWKCEAHSLLECCLPYAYDNDLAAGIFTRDQYFWKTLLNN